ncbi:hypothetical protein NDU88_002288 [Pleurodeles waltl]|uniref:Uncharacterized protein n=1 Tax=Pleurodeles waltl TaxID=8319 RepID=A0AAV7TK45_PLEWA|nr:hypothetical protein NDU88_002288 [Pleurodeles waltl]
MALSKVRSIKHRSCLWSRNAHCRVAKLAAVRSCRASAGTRNACLAMRRPARCEAGRKAQALAIAVSESRMEIDVCQCVDNSVSCYATYLLIWCALDNPQN